MLHGEISGSLSIELFVTHANKTEYIMELPQIPKNYQKLLKEVSGYDDHLCRKVIAIYRGQMVPEDAIREGIIGFNLRWTTKPPHDYGNSLRRCITYAWDQLQKKVYRENAEKVARERERNWVHEKEDHAIQHRESINTEYGKRILSEIINNLDLNEQLNRKP